MRKKLPNVFANKNVKSNNMLISHEQNASINIYNRDSIKEKIINIVNDTDFNYRKHVIITNKNNLKKEIILIGISNDNIITLDDGIININDITDIKKVDLTQHK